MHTLRPLVISRDVVDIFLIKILMRFLKIWGCRYNNYMSS